MPFAIQCNTNTLAVRLEQTTMSILSLDLEFTLFGNVFHIMVLLLEENKQFLKTDKLMCQ